MPYNQFAGVGEETTYGTIVARSKFAKVMAGSTLNHKADRDKTAKLSANLGGDPEGNFDKGQRGEGKLIIPCSYDDGLFLKVLKHLLGTCATAGGAPPYTHTFTRSVTLAGGGTPTAVALTAELNFELPDAGPLQARVLAGARIMGGNFAWNAGEEIVLDADLIGKEVTQVVKSGSPTYPDYDTYEMKFSQATVSINGTAFGPVCSGLNFAISNGHEPRIRLGSVYTQRPLRRGVASLSGAVRLDWEDTPSSKVLWQAFKDNVYNSIVVTLTGPSGYSMVVTLSKVKFNESTLTPDEGELQAVEFPFEAYNDATNTAVKIAVQNSTATV